MTDHRGDRDLAELFDGTARSPDDVQLSRMEARASGVAGRRNRGGVLGIAGALGVVGAMMVLWWVTPPEPVAQEIAAPPPEAAIAEAGDLAERDLALGAYFDIGWDLDEPGLDLDDTTLELSEEELLDVYVEFLSQDS